jgi:hypothetical protein
MSHEGSGCDLNVRDSNTGRNVGIYLFTALSSPALGTCQPTEAYRGLFPQKSSCRNMKLTIHLRLEHLSADIHYTPRRRGAYSKG